MRTAHLSQSMLSLYESNLYFSSMPTMCNASIITLWSSGVNNVFPFRLEGGGAFLWFFAKYRNLFLWIFIKNGNLFVWIILIYYFCTQKQR